MRFLHDGTGHRLCAVWPTENWLGSSLNPIQGWTTVRESNSRALEQGPLGGGETLVSIKRDGTEGMRERERDGMADNFSHLLNV